MLLRVVLCVPSNRPKVHHRRAGSSHYGGASASSQWGRSFEVITYLHSKNEAGAGVGSYTDGIRWNLPQSCSSNSRLSA